MSTKGNTCLKDGLTVENRLLSVLRARILALKIREA